MQEHTKLLAELAGAYGGVGAIAELKKWFREQV
jgi:hypothetical protein